MAEDEKAVPGPVPGKDLTSKIATAYRTLPPEQREKSLQNTAEVENPELDKAFDKMVGMYKVRRPERENAVVSFPAPPTLRVPKPEASPEGEDYVCPECGHNNPAANQFCGMCGAAREDAAPADLSRLESDEFGAAAPLSESAAKHHHHYYHHHHYRNNPYLLVAVALLLAMIAWQQWQAYKQQAQAKPTTTPAVQGQPQAPAQVQPQPAPSTKPASQAPASVPEKNSQPPKKPASQPASQSLAAPVRQGEPPGLPVKAVASAPTTEPAQVSYQPLVDQPIPALPLFSATPPKPEAAQQRVTLSQWVSAGRLIKSVPPIYPVTARRAGLQGEVVLQAVIAKDGSVQDVKPVRGDPVLAEAAMRAVRQWRYQPATLNGQPVEAETLVQVNFSR